MKEKISKTKTEWQRQLTPEQFQIARLGGTESPFTGKYCDEKGDGVYSCVCCGEELFNSEKKFDSRSGWPSFWEPIKADRVGEVSDTSHGMQRIEVTCSRCDGHLGHVFNDGPEPTGLRYCINSASLLFKNNEES